MRFLQRHKQLAKAHVASVANGWPARRMKIILVAGQDGSGITCATLSTILQISGARTGVITQNYVDVGGERARGSDQADVLGDAFRLQKLLRHMKAARCGFVIIEVPPTMPVHQFAGVHPYLLVVRRVGDSYLTTVANSQRASQIHHLLNLRPHLVACNRDDTTFEAIRGHLHPSPSLMTFGAHPNAECRMQQVSMHAQGSEASLIIDNQTEIKLATVMPGKQAAYSVVAAAAAAYLLGTSITAIEDGVQRTLPQPGYLQELPIDRPYQLVFDSAVSPEGIAENLDAMMHFSKNRVLAVLGANLAQPSGWWPVLGEVVAQNADRVVVTDGDLPVGENAKHVRDQLLAGVIQDGAEARTDEVADRMEAIGRAMSIARRNDTVVIVGGSMRAYRQQGNDRLPWSDVDAIEQLLG